MADGTRFLQLAESLASVKQNQEQNQLNHQALQQLVQGLAQKLDLVTSHVETLVQSKAAQNAGDPGGSGQITNPLYEEHMGIQTKAVRLDFLKFNGDNPSGWIYRANQFFNYHQTNPHHRILMASFHMEGKALVWFQDIEAAGGLSSWDGFIRALLTRFGASPYDDPMEALIRLKQTTTVEEYKSQFEFLSNQLRGLAKSYKLSCFLSGIKEDIRFMVRMLNPPNLHMAFGLAKMQEENVAALRRTARAGVVTLGPRISQGLLGPNDKGLLGPNEKRAMVPIQRLSPMQMRERREKGLCYNCDDKWGPSHKCKSARLFILEGEDGDETIKFDEWGNNLHEGLDTEEVEPEISIHALCGSPNPKTMRIIGQVGRKTVVILIDTGSTHNFIDPAIIQLSQIPYDAESKMQVKVANGQAVYCEGKSNAVSLLMQGHSYTIDFFILTLGGCDVVLGVQWLRTLGPILWDFLKLQMAFTIMNKPRRLQGMISTGTSIIKGENSVKHLDKIKED